MMVEPTNGVGLPQVKLTKGNWVGIVILALAYAIVQLVGGLPGTASIERKVDEHATRIEVSMERFGTKLERAMADIDKLQPMGERLTRVEGKVDQISTEVEGLKKRLNTSRVGQPVAH